MDEVEYRITGHEMALIEVAAHIEQDDVIAAIGAIRSGLVAGITEEERVIRLRALNLLDAALGRTDTPLAMGLHWRGPPQGGGLDAVRMLQDRLSRPYPPGDD